MEKVNTSHTKENQTKKAKRKRQLLTSEENLPKGWFWVWWPESGWWKVLITDIGEEDWFWPRTQQPLATPLLPLTLRYESDEKGSTCFIEEVIWHNGEFYDQEGEERITFCLTKPQELGEENKEEAEEKEISEKSYSGTPSSPVVDSSSSSLGSQEKLSSQRNKFSYRAHIKQTGSVNTSPKKVSSSVYDKATSSLRERAKVVLNEVLRENVQETNVPVEEAGLLKIATEIEKALFERYFKEEYLAQLRSITFNLRGRRNLELKKALVLSEISPSKVAEMTTAELASQSLRTERKKREQESLARAVIRDPTDVGIVKGMSSVEEESHRKEETYSNQEVLPNEWSVSSETEHVEQISKTTSDDNLIDNESRQLKEWEQKTEHQQPFGMRRNAEVDFAISNNLDDKLQQFASSLGQKEDKAVKDTNSVLRGSTTEAIRSRRRHAVWQGEINCEMVGVSFKACAYALTGPNIYHIVPSILQVIGRTELHSTVEFVRSLEYSTSREFSTMLIKMTATLFSPNFIKKEQDDEKGLKVLVEFLSRRNRAAVLFQNSQSEAYIFPPGKITSRIHDYGSERVLGVVVNRKMGKILEPTQDTPGEGQQYLPTTEGLSTLSTTNTASSVPSGPQGVSESNIMDLPKTDKSSTNATEILSHYQPYNIVSMDTEQLDTVETEENNVTSPTETTSSPKAKVSNFPFATKIGSITVPGLTKGPSLSNVLGNRATPGIPGLNKTTGKDNEASKRTS
eukprot:jgi/Galph1/5467/GphlegSOOS_G4185.1